ncbi:MAG TPA: sialidase family protein [Pirellula sp.]|nr:sialidase family protein [Pirellula sp.]
MSDEKMDLPKRGAEEPCIVERRDGSLLALMRTSLGAIYRSESFDQGRTWNSPVTTLLTAPASPPCIKRIPSTNDLIVVWNHNYDETHHHQGERNPLSSAISKDDGATWQHIKDVEFKPGGAAAYASVFFQDDEAIVSYYYQEKGFGGGSGVRLKFLPIAWFYE